MVFSNEAGTLIDNDIFIKNIAKNIKQKNEEVGKMKWISIKTTSDQYNQGKWKNGTSSEDKIRFLAVKKYSSQQSSAIYNTLSKDDGTYGNAGNDIYFSPEGHLGLNLLPGGTNVREDGDNPTWIPNKLAAQNSSKEWVKANFSTSLTLGATADITNFLFRDKKICMFSPNLHWIVYYHPTESTETPQGKTIQAQYYLLYNPLYRSAFKAIYRALVKTKPEARGIVGAGTSLGQGVQATGYNAPYNDNTTFTDIVNKYCNAFILPRGKMPGGTDKLEHYGDPMCNIIMNSTYNLMSVPLGEIPPDKKFNEGTHGRLASVLRMNITQKSLLKDYYNGPAGKSRKFTNLYDTLKNAGEFYVCGDDGKSQNSLSFGGYATNIARHINISSTGTTSFLQDFFNLRKNPRIMTGVGNPVAVRDTNDGYWGSTNERSTGGCGPIHKQITFCSMNFVAGGDINLTDTNLENTCGGGGDKSGAPGDATNALSAAQDTSEAMQTSTGNSTKSDAEIASEVRKGTSNIIVKKNDKKAQGLRSAAYTTLKDTAKNEAELQANLATQKADDEAAAATARAAALKRIKDSEPNNMVYIVAIIVVLIILIALGFYFLF